MGFHVFRVLLNNLRIKLCRVCPVALECQTDRLVGLDALEAGPVLRLKHHHSCVPQLCMLRRFYHWVGRRETIPMRCWLSGELRHEHYSHDREARSGCTDAVMQRSFTG